MKTQTLLLPGLRSLTKIKLFVLIFGFCQLSTICLAQTEYDEFQYRLKTNSPVLAGKDLVLMALGGQLYEWTGPNNFYSTRKDIVISNADVTQAGLYNLTVWDTITGKTYYLSEFVEVTAPANVFIQTTNNSLSSCDNSNFDVSVNTSLLPSPPNNYTFDWICNPGIGTISSGTSATLFFPANTGSTITYSLTLTITDLSNNSVVVVETIYIKVYNCCQLAVNTPVFDNVTLSSVTLPTNLGVIAINGIFLADIPFVLPANVTDVIMLPGSSIVLTSSMTAESAHFHHCTEMWDGIYNIMDEIIPPDFVFELADCIFEDAINAIYIVHSQSVGIHANDCHFVNNNVGLFFMYNYSVVLDIQANTFEATRPLYPALWAQNPPEQPWSKAGIMGWFNHPSTIANPNDPYTNVFRNLGYGIYVGSWPLSIKQYGARFENIPGLTGNSYPGIGVNSLYFNNTWLPYIPWLIKVGNNSQNIDFYQCKYGIWQRGGHSEIYGNTFANCDNGIKQEKSKYADINIFDNDISVNKLGIEITQCNPVNSLSIRDNIIHVSGEIGTTNNFGIRIDESGFAPVGPPFNYFIGFNSIYCQEVQYGIYALNCKLSLITENDIFLLSNNPVTNYAGIYISNSRACGLSCNYIEGVSPNLGDAAPGSERPYAIQVGASTDNVIGFNTTSNTYSGIVFDDYSAGIDIKRNRLFSHYTGLLYRPNGETNAQYLKDNTWEGSFYNLKAHFEGVSLQPWTVKDYGVYNPLPLVDPSNGWFIAIPDFTSPVPSPCSSQGSSMLMTTDTSITLQDSLIAQNNSSFVSNPMEIRWSRSRILYDKLEQDNGLLSNNVVMQSFYDSISNESPAYFQEIENQAIQAMTVSTVSQQLLDTLLAQQKNLIAGLSAVDSSLCISQNTLQDSLLRIQRSIVMAQLANVGVQIQSAIAGISAIISGNVSLLITANGYLPDTTLIENNEKIVNDIIFNTIVQGSSGFTQTQTDNIYNIAIQCPISGGRSVYMARSLYALISDTLFDDYTICLSQGIVKNQSISPQITTSRSFTMFPNPAVDKVTLEWNQAADEEAEIIILNAINQVVSRQKISLAGNTNTFSVSGLNPGIYGLLVNQQNTPLVMLKLIILE